MLAWLWRAELRPWGGPAGQDVAQTGKAFLVACVPFFCVGSIPLGPGHQNEVPGDGTV